MCLQCVKTFSCTKSLVLLLRCVYSVWRHSAVLSLWCCCWGVFTVCKTFSWVPGAVVEVCLQCVQMCLQCVKTFSCTKSLVLLLRCVYSVWRHSAVLSLWCCCWGVFTVCEDIQLYLVCGAVVEVCLQCWRHSAVLSRWGVFTVCEDIQLYLVCGAVVEVWSKRPGRSTVSQADALAGLPLETRSGCWGLSCQT